MSEKEVRLIDANALKKLRHDYIQGRLNFDCNEYDLIDKCPTIDAMELPCSVGDKVYRIDKGNFRSNWKPFIKELTVTEISWKVNAYGKDLGWGIIADGVRYKFSSVGKSVFLTRKEAEVKLDGDE